jgi:phage baseplate assembly protein W
MNGDFIGSGWAFPLRTDAAGGIALVSGERKLEESMRLILSTAPGERPMRPEFGCGIHDFVFAGADDETIAQIVVEVRQALARWEPRVTVEEVLVTRDEDNPARLLIEVQYASVSTNDPRNLVFPFYTIPGEAEG